MKKKLIALAKKNDFEGYFLKEWGFNSKEPLRYYFWLCELQQWLRNEHGWFLGVECSLGRFFYHGYDIDPERFTFDNFDEIGEGELQLTYEEALEIGLFESLKILDSIKSRK